MRLFLITALLLVASSSLSQANDTKTPPLKILAFGDSLTAGYGLPAGAAYPDVLERLMLKAGHNVDIINAGVSGETTTGGVNRLDWAMQHTPEIVILALGANDALRFIDPDVTRKNISDLIARIQDKGAKVFLLGMYAPPNAGAEFTQKFNKIYPDLAQQYNVTLYPFILKDVAAKPDLNLDDGVHPNAEGAKIIANNLLPYLSKLID